MATVMSEEVEKKIRVESTQKSLISAATAKKVKVPSSYICSITEQVMIDPVFAVDGHTYEREAIEDWLKTHDTSPKTNLKLKHKELIENHDKRGDILGFLQEHSELYDKDEVYLPKSWVSGLVADIKANKIKGVQNYLARDRRLLMVKLEGEYTAFHLACQFGSVELANILLESLTKRNVFDEILKQSPIGFKPVYSKVGLRLQEQAERISQLEKEVARLMKEKKHQVEASVETPSSVHKSPLIFSDSSSSSPSSYSDPTSDLKVTAEKIRKFLNHVAAGQQDEAEAMLKENRDLALASGTVTDHAKRTFKNITGFQYAVWALDWHMWKMIRKYLPIEAAQEQAKRFAEGSWVTEHEEHVDWKKLTEAQRILIDNWVLWDWLKIKKHWVQQIGGAQLLLPIHVLQEYNHPDRPFDPCPKFDAEIGLYRGSVSGILSGLGHSQAISRGNESPLHCGECPTSTYHMGGDMHYFRKPVGADSLALVALASTRIQQRAQLVAELVKKPGRSSSK